MKRIRTALVIAAAIGTLTLSGCASNPDVTGLEQSLSEIDGVNGSLAYTTHSGAPWNTQVVVLLFVDDPTEEGVVATTRAAAPVLAEDPASAGREVSVYFIDGERADYAGRSEAFRDSVVITPELAQSLGVELSGGSERLPLSPDDVRRIADGS
ncbi:hypothetical protein [Microbacterium sp. SSM24]|uniref:hypothetical protein n=1 Tax=Microbacterium sp. SSM24 TaxID=2991714 RepID=UPI0022280751|nr:hypothetical protein [Microbacterium sp. SSM24]MCW3492811.1 hypothetical protein [Microbacterium sp. SSM24]